MWRSNEGANLSLSAARALVCGGMLPPKLRLRPPKGFCAARRLTSAATALTAHARRLTSAAKPPKDPDWPTAPTPNAPERSRTLPNAPELPKTPSPNGSPTAPQRLPKLTPPTPPKRQNVSAHNARQLRCRSAAAPPPRLCFTPIWSYIPPSGLTSACLLTSCRS